MSGIGNESPTVAKPNPSPRPRFGMSKGDKIWIPDTDEGFITCTLKEIKNGVASCFDDNYKAYDLPLCDVFPVNPPLYEGVPDNTELMYLHDPSLLNNVRIRYSRYEIYTYTAYILIAVNPYQSIPIYGLEYIKAYANKAIGRMPPHVYALADHAYRALRAKQPQNQAIIVSGESGAGKTETCKYIMRFLAMVDAEGESTGNINELEKKILDANPILEAFGNAKTLRNNNSSRFGKFTELHFNGQYQMVGAAIETYLLEKGRVIGQSKGERSFHIFYQLLKGAPVDVRQAIQLLPAAQDYRLLSESGCYDIANVNDKANYDEMSSAMTSLGISAADKQSLFGILSALLRLGNIVFQDVKDECSIESSSKSALNIAGNLLGLNEGVLLQRMLNRTMKAGLKSEVITIALNATEAKSTRDTLIKYVYGQVFTWLVARINKSVPSADRSRYIGILDISGFEIFECNSFEQFCINFANEKIQQYFNKEILYREQYIYETEGLRYRKVDYMDNQDIIDLFEAKRSGIFALLNEECLMPKCTDKTFSIKVHTTHSADRFLTKPKYGKKTVKRLNDDEAFVIKHFAGEVVYEAVNFLIKNNDTIHDDLIKVLNDSTIPFVKSIFPQGDKEEIQYGASGGRFQSVSKTFMLQLDSLMAKLGKTKSNFIRCIKPNNQQTPGIFNGPEVMTQLRYSGMCAALLLMQAGFPTRIRFEDLYDQFAPRMPRMMAKLKPQTFCEALLVALDLLGGKDFQMGLTKVFFRAGQLAVMEDLTTSNAASVENIVRKVRKWLARKRFFAAGYAVVSINLWGKLVDGVRVLKRLRRAARFMVKMVQVWIPCLQRVRKRLYSDEIMKKRRAVEEERKRLEEEERLRLEAIAVAKEKAEEEWKRLAEEERKRKKEEARRKEEDSRREMEQKIQELAENKAQITSKLETLAESFQATTELLTSETKNRRSLQSSLEEALGVIEVELQAKAALQVRLNDERAAFQKQITDITACAQGDVGNAMLELEKTSMAKQATEKELGDARESIRSLQEQVDALKSSLADSKQLYTKLEVETTATAANLNAAFSAYKAEATGRIAGLDAKLKAECDTGAELTAALNAKDEEACSLQANLSSMSDKYFEGVTLLKNEQKVRADLETDLRHEKNDREDDNLHSTVLLQETQSKAEKDLKVKDSIIESLKIDKEKLERKLDSEAKAHAEALIASENRYKVASESMETIEKAYKDLEVECASLKNEKAIFAKEKVNLIQTAVRCQTTIVKLKHIYDKFKTDEELLRLIYGDASFKTMMKSSTLVKGGTMNKQGGNDPKKWALRHFVLTDIFLVYYGSPTDKSPKGVIRMDQCRTEKVDLSSISKTFGIKVIATHTGREYRMSAPSEDELNDWLDSLQRAETF